MKFILNTNVVPELRKVSGGKADKRVAKWGASVVVTDFEASGVKLLNPWTWDGKA